MPHRVLLVADNPKLTGIVTEFLAEAGFVCDRAFDGGLAKELFSRAPSDAVLFQLDRHPADLASLIAHVKSVNPFIVLIALGERGPVCRAIDALKLGANDYFEEPIDPRALLSTLNRNLKRISREREVKAREVWPGEDQLGRAFLDAPSALLKVDPSGVIRIANRAAARVLARNPERLYGRALTEFVSDRIRDEWIELLRLEAASPRGYEGEIHLRRESGEWFPASVTAILQRESGDLIVSVSDLTRQKAVERRLFESKKLASLGQVVEGVAHEVRNPLLAIGGFVRKLRSTMPEESRERGYTDIIIKEMERLERMVREIEEYVFFAKNNHRDFGFLDVAELLSDSVDAAVKARPQAAGVRLTFIRPGDATGIYGDRALIRELFDGLLSNAFESMPGGGELKVLVSLNEGWVTVKIADTGIGIDPAQLDEIYNPFYTSKTKGAGLGLAKAHMIVDDHEGYIRFASEVGRGTECTVTLPVDRRRILKRSEKT